MNKKGFTLTEILAVIVILAVVMTIGSVSITAIKRKIDKNMFENKLEFIISAAKNWGNDNKSKILTTSAKKTVADLIQTTLTTEETSAIGSYTCSKTAPDGMCYVITNNLNGKVINDLTLNVYMEHNRVYACFEKTAENKNLLDEKDDWSEYGGLNYYCA